MMKVTATPRAEQSKKPKLNRDTQKGYILSILASNSSLNRFDAEHHGAHALHSVIASIEKLGIQVDREWEEVQSRWGHGVRVKRYFLKQEARERARELLGEGGDDG